MKLFLALSLALVCSLKAEDGELRRELERVYSAWRSSMESRDLAGWQRSTAAYRQAVTRNIIVSQKQPFPGALFALPMHPPSTSSLRLVKTEVVGPTAHLVYFGKVDLGITDSGEVPENLLVLKYIKEAGNWKFDATRIINLAGAAEIRAQLKNSGNSPALNDPDLIPSGAIPATPAPCRAPDHIALLQISSLGYSTGAKVNNFDIATVTDTAEQHLIIGGLNNGENPLKLTIKPTEVAEGVKRELQINALVLTGEEGRPTIRVFTWKPTGETAAGAVDLIIHVNRLTLKGSSDK